MNYDPAPVIRADCKWLRLAAVVFLRVQNVGSHLVLETAGHFYRDKLRKVKGER